MKINRVLWLFLILSLIVLAKPHLALVGDWDLYLSTWLTEADVSFLNLSFSDLEPSLLEQLDVLIINQAPKLGEGVVKNLKRYLRSHKKLVIFSEVIAQDLIEGALEDDSIAYTLGITNLNPLTNVELVLGDKTLPLKEAYSFSQRKATELAIYNNNEVAVSYNNNALLIGLRSLSFELAQNNDLKELFFAALKSFLITRKPLEQARNKIPLADLPHDKINLYEKALELERGLDKVSLGKALSDYDEALALYKEAYLYTLPSRDRETRALWFRPPSSKREITESLDQMASLGINLIFVETWWEGSLLYPNGPVNQRPEFRGWDPLEYIITEAKKRNIEVHAWLEVFFSGYKKPGEILEKHPNWAAVGIDGKIPVRAEDDKYFIDPANLEAQAFLIDMFVDMVKRYNLDGLHLDYIRYPLQTPVAYSFSLSSKKRFAQTTGLEFPTGTSHPNWVAFSKFKEEQVTNFVASLREAVLKFRPLQISAAVFPGNDAIINKNQNWPLWIEKGYLDFISLMLYSRSTATVENWIQDSKRQIGDKIPYYPALAAISIPEGDLLIEQTLLIQKYTLPGVAFFAWNHFNTDIINKLSLGPFRIKAKREEFK